VTAAQITAVVVAWCLIGALAGAIANLSTASDPAVVIRSIDGNAAQVIEVEMTLAAEAA
jgi:hypothetical protein